MVRQATLQDMPIVAGIHKKIFSDHFIGMLPTYLISRFYSRYLKKENVFLVCEDGNGEILGFVMGGGAHQLSECQKSFLKKNFVFLMFHIIVTPKIYPLFLTNLKMMVRNILFSPKKNKPKTSSHCRFRLLSIGVQNKSKGKGIAQQLLLHFEETLIVRNVYNYGLSVKISNERAVNFYQKSDFLIENKTNSELYFCKTMKE